MNYLFFLTIATIPMVALALREAYRYRLLTSTYAKLTTCCALIGVLVWTGGNIGAFIFLPPSQAVSILIFSFATGSILRSVFIRVSGGNKIFSLECEAKRKYNDRVVKSAIEEFYNYPGPEVAKIIESQGLTVSDLLCIYNRLLRCGLSPSEAVVAVGKPKVIDYCFNKMQEGDEADNNTVQKLITLARYEV